MRTIVNADVALLHGATVDGAGRTTLVYDHEGEMRGRVLDAVLARCGGSTRVNQGSRLSIYSVVVSQPNEVAIAGVESVDPGETSRLLVRRYGLPSCPLSAASTSVTSSLSVP